MKEYIFNFRAIPVARDSYGQEYTGQKSFVAGNFEDAIEKAELYFKRNLQFRFEYNCIIVS